MASVLGAAAAAACWLVQNVSEKLVADTMKALAADGGLEGDIADLRAELRRAHLLLGAARGHAGKVEHHEALATSVRRIEQLAHDADNLLDELRYSALQQQIEGTYQSNGSILASTSRSIGQFGRTFTRQASKVLSSASSTEKIIIQQVNNSRATKRSIDSDDAIDDKMKKLKLSSDDEISAGKMWILNIADISDRIKTIVGQLHEIYDDVRRTLKIENLKGSTSENERADVRETSAYPTKTDGSWREQEKIKIKAIMTSTQVIDNKLSVLPVVGDGGLGKTTLARQIYNDPEVKEHFEIRIWIYVSPNFDEVKLTQEILAYFSADGKYDKTTNFNTLQTNVEGKLVGQRKPFLLILDDMWEDKEMTRWHKLLAPLECAGVNGNVVLVTARSLAIAKTIMTTEHITLEGLKDDIFWHFFKGCIFGDGNDQEHKKLLKIGKTIATKLNGNPLAARSVGALLKRNLNEGYWRRIVESEEWKSQDILPALMLSYNHLPYHLQRCFSYCTLFPKGYMFAMEELVHIWIAQGLVYSNDDRIRMEDIGSDYLNDLVDHSFFQKIDKQQGEYYLMHDLMHDLAQIVSADNCFTIDGSECKTMSPFVRHISIIAKSAYKGDMKRNESFEKKLDKIKNDETLRRLSTLILVGAYDWNFASKFKNFIEKLQYVRVLRLSDVDVLLNFSKFIHLRYLQLGCTSRGNCLPAAVCRFYHLQVLDLRFWADLRDLPRGISNLRNLRHLLVPVAPDRETLHSRITEVGKLTSLQELSEFVVRKDNEDFKIGQLGNLEDLRGSLNIYSLQNVKDKQAASSANLRAKKYLRKLSLSWDKSQASGSTSAPQTGVLEGLEPNENLEHLTIRNYNGDTSLWLGTECSLSYLESLHLEDCGRWEVLPPLKKLPFLKKLVLNDMSSLKELTLGSDDSGVDIDIESSEDDMSLSEGTSLIELNICLCPRLRSLRLHSCTSLQKLTIKQCGLLSSLEGLGCLNQLNRLEITQSSGFAAAWNFAAQHVEQEFQLPLQELHIDDSSVLTEPICNMLGALRLLTLRGDGFSWSCQVKNLTEEQGEALSLLTSVEELHFSKCQSFTLLPTALHRLRSLKKLWIEDSASIMSLPEGGLPDSMEELKVHNCSEETNGSASTFVACVAVPEVRCGGPSLEDSEVEDPEALPSVELDSEPCSAGGLGWRGGEEDARGAAGGEGSRDTAGSGGTSGAVQVFFFFFFLFHGGSEGVPPLSACFRGTFAGGCTITGRGSTAELGLRIA